MKKTRYDDHRWLAGMTQIFVSIAAASEYATRPKRCSVPSTMQVQNPHVDLELDEIELEECIGRGGHGAVYKVRLLVCMDTASVHDQVRVLSRVAWQRSMNLQNKMLSDSV